MVFGMMSVSLVIVIEFVTIIAVLALVSGENHIVFAVPCRCGVWHMAPSTMAECVCVCVCVFLAVSLYDDFVELFHFTKANSVDMSLTGSCGASKSPEAATTWLRFSHMPV